MLKSLPAEDFRSELRSALISYYDGILKIPGACGRPEAQVFKRSFNARRSVDPPAAAAAAAPPPDDPARPQDAPAPAPAPAPAEAEDTERTPPPPEPRSPAAASPAAPAAAAGAKGGDVPGEARARAPRDE